MVKYLFSGVERMVDLESLDARHAKVSVDINVCRSCHDASKTYSREALSRRTGAASHLDSKTTPLAGSMGTDRL